MFHAVNAILAKATKCQEYAPLAQFQLPQLSRATPILAVTSRDKSVASASITFTHYWRWHTRLPERFGQPCGVLAAGGSMNSLLIQFADGRKYCVSRWAVRQMKRLPTWGALAGVDADGSVRGQGRSRNGRGDAV
jgi:hypothetical protein